MKNAKTSLYVKTSRESIKANLTRMAESLNNLNEAATEIGIDRQTVTDRANRALDASNRLDGAENLLGNAFGIHVIRLYKTGTPKIRALEIEWSKDEQPETVLVP